MPSRAMANRICGAPRKVALTVLTAAGSEISRINILPPLPNTSMAASATGICDVTNRSMDRT